MNFITARNRLTYMFFTLVIFGFVIFAGCRNPFDPPVGHPPTAGKGNGTFTLQISRVSAGRTILPATVQSDFAVYTLVFSSSGLDDFSVDRNNLTLGDSVLLPIATWDLKVTAFMDAGKTRPAAEGSLSGIVIGEGNTAGSVELKAIIEAGASGVFIWDIGFPSEVILASISIIPLNPETGTAEQTLCSHYAGGWIIRQKYRVPDRYRIR